MSKICWLKLSKNTKHKLVLYSDESQGLGSLANWWCFQTFHLMVQALSYIDIHIHRYIYMYTCMQDLTFQPWNCIDPCLCITTLLLPTLHAIQVAALLPTGHKLLAHPLQDASGNVGRDCSAWWHLPTGTKHLQQQSGSEGLNHLFTWRAQKMKGTSVSFQVLGI